MSGLNNKYYFIAFVWLFLVSTGSVIAQDRAIGGVVFDKVTSERIAKVNILNTRTNETVYNTLKAEFKINAREGDLLIASKQDYFPDTIKVTDKNSILVYLKPTSTQLRQVTIRDTVLTPEKKLLATKQEFSKVYGSSAYRDPLTLSPGSGAGISIDAIWNSISRSGRNAAKLRGIIEQDYHEDVIDFRFSKTFVAGVTGLKEPQLTDFMRKYRPGYYTVLNASDYEFVSQIKLNLRRYLRNTRAYTLPPLTSLQQKQP